ncbi:MAG: dTMP kinase [Cytophagales bacterium]|nr:dTMP kinase [Cytophagales bacterium]
MSPVDPVGPVDPVAKGIFISFEGIDGAGKSTHIAGLSEALSSKGYKVTLTREPGGTALAEKLRTLILNDAMDALTESLLVFAARRDHVAHVIRPALARGDVVLCDRFTDATFAYQGAGRGFDLQTLATLEHWVQVGLQPDLTYWFDLAPPLAAERLASARVPDKFEAQPVAFFEAVQSGYALRAKNDPTRFARIEANQSRDAVFADVLAVAKDRGYLD